MKRIPIHTMLLKDSQIVSYGTGDKGRQGAELYYQVWNWNKGIRGNVCKLQKKENEADLFWEETFTNPQMVLE
eukprot:7245893-Ditylum_brightwellii.AAC.1